METARATANTLSTGTTSGEGARAFAHYEDHHESYKLVTQDDLREISGFGWIQQGLLSAGAFFFSGAFWLFAEKVSGQDKFQITPWMGTCILSMLFGVALVIVSLIMFALKQKRISKYFKR